jgi:putative ABC transport system substrate-binding protein
MRRREFIIGGAAAAWPLAARAQQADRVRRVGILMGSADNAEFRPRVTLFAQTLAQLGWIDGRNVKIDIRWNANDPQRMTAHARELVQLKPDVILASPSRVVIPLQKETRTIPIVFVTVTDPIGQGIVDNLARPSGNTTGFTNLEFSLIGKWLQILKEAAPKVTRAGLMISTSNAASSNWYSEFKKIAPTFGVEPVAAPITDRADIERTVNSLSRQPGDALIVAGDTFVEIPSNRRLIVELTAANRLPALYGVLSFASEGALICYGVDQLDPFRRAASYVDRILKGEKPSDLPVQQPTKFRFTINLKTAKALGLDPSTTLVAAADEVIE